MRTDYMSVPEAAIAMQVSRQAIYRAIRLGRLHAYEDSNGDLRIYRAHLEEYNENRYARYAGAEGTPGESELIFDERKGILSAVRAAEILNIPLQKVYYACRTGMLRATRHRHSWVILVRDIEAYEKRYLRKEFTRRRIA